MSYGTGLEKPTKEPLYLVEVMVADPSKCWIILGFGYPNQGPDGTNHVVQRILVDKIGLMDLQMVFKLEQTIPILKEYRRGRTTSEAIQKWLDEEWEPDFMHGVMRRHPESVKEKGFTGPPEMINYCHGDEYVMMGFLVDGFTREEADAKNTYFCSMTKETLFAFVDHLKAHPEPTHGFKRYPPKEEEDT